MIKIDPDTFTRHWVKGKTERTIVSKFEKNIFDFTTVVGDYSKRFFRMSFTYGGFYGSGTKWQPRKNNRWSRKFNHRTLFDSHKLRDGIQGGVSDASQTLFHMKISARKGQRKLTYNIHTNESFQAEKGKRGISKKRLKRNYAAIHNSDPSKNNFTVNGKSSIKPIQRQFIGRSKKLDSGLTRFYNILFRGFPC